MATKHIILENIIANSKVSVDSAAVYTLSAADAAASIASAAGVGTFDWTANNASDAKFVADAALSGEVDLNIAAGATLKSADFSKAAGITYTGGANVASITGGAGNDYVKIDATTGVAASVTLGAGADTLEFDDAATKDVTLADYNYYQGDVIKAKGDVAVSDNGGLTAKNTTGGTVSVTAAKIAVEDNWYAAKVDNGTAITDYFTAVAGNNQNVTKDLSKSTVKNVVNAEGAKTANITLGHGNDTVSLAAASVGGADTIKIGNDSGSNTISKFDATKDVFAIDSVKLAEITLGATTGNKVELKYGKSTVDSGIATPDSGAAFNINDGSKTHKLAYATDDALGTTITYATSSDADWFYGAAPGNTVLEVGSTTHLHDITKYKNITNIKVADDAKLDAPISLTGAIGAQNTINASAAKVGTAIWGFSKEDDSITLGAGQDTVWFGAGDGTDSISKFKYGTASDSDVLYLKDTQNLKDIKVANNGADADFTVGKSVAKVKTVVGAVDVAQIKLANEKIYKVAGDFKAAGVVNIDTDAIDGLDYYAFSKTDQQVNITGSKDWIVHSLYTDCYTTGATIKAIDATNATGKVTLAAAASINGGKGTSNIWTYQANTSASVTGGDGTDIIWFAENADKDVHVNTFDTNKDIVKFATAKSLKEIAEGYTFASAAANQATITGATNTDSQLILDKNGTIDLVDGSDKAYKALIMNTVGGGTTGAFSTDVNIYAGMTDLTAGGSVEGTVKVRLGKESRGLSSDTYFIDDSVDNFNASNSSATFWVAGNAKKTNTITGGLTENYLYGGGASADWLNGSVLAKDTFYFGTGDGSDTVAAGVDTKDTIALWNIADADIANVKVSVDTDENTVSVSLTDSSSLNITDANAISALKNGLTFTSASQTAYTYDSESKTLVKKA